MMGVGEMNTSAGWGGGKEGRARWRLCLESGLGKFTHDAAREGTII